MADFFASLPQGVYWYPVVAALLFVAVRSLLQTRFPSPRARTGASPPLGALAGYANLISRAGTDRFAESELERLCIGMLLQTAGYRGYSIDACRHYVEHGASPTVAGVLREHLAEAPDSGHPREGILPSRCELIVRELESITEES